MPACRRFRELIDSIFFTFGTRKYAACKCGNFREAISYMHLARFASSVYHTSLQMSLCFPWFPILSQFHFFLWIIYQLIIKLFYFLCCTLAPQPDLKQFQMVRITRISLKHITPDVILRNLIKSPTTCWCPIDFCQTLKKANLENSDLESTELENVVYDSKSLKALGATPV